MLQPDHNFPAFRGTAAGGRPSGIAPPNRPVRPDPASRLGNGQSQQEPEHVAQSAPLSEPLPRDLAPSRMAAGALITVGTTICIFSLVYTMQFKLGLGFGLAVAGGLVDLLGVVAIASGSGRLKGDADVSRADRFR